MENQEKHIINNSICEESMLVILLNGVVGREKQFFDKKKFLTVDKASIKSQKDDLICV